MTTSESERDLAAVACTSRFQENAHLVRCDHCGGGGGPCEHDSANSPTGRYFLSPCCHCYGYGVLCVFWSSGMIAAHVYELLGRAAPTVRDVGPYREEQRLTGT